MNLKEFREENKDREVMVLLDGIFDITKEINASADLFEVVGAEYPPNGPIKADVVIIGTNDSDNDGFDDDFEYSDGYLHRVKEPNTSRGILYNIKLFYQKVFDKIKCFFIKMHLYGRKHPIMYLMGCFCFGIMARLFVCKMFGFDFWRNGYKKKK